MAACTYSSLNVVGPVDASRSSVVGNYVADGTVTVGGQTFTRYVLGGDTNYRIQASQIGGGPEAGKFAWFLYAPIGGPPGMGVEQYKTARYATIGELPDCPVSGTVTWEVNSVGVPGPVPSVNAPGPDCTNPLNRCDYAAGGESGVVRFRRLVALGYV